MVYTIERSAVFIRSRSERGEGEWQVWFDLELIKRLDCTHCLVWRKTRDLRKSITDIGEILTRNHRKRCGEKDHRQEEKRSQLTTLMQHGFSILDSMLVSTLASNSSPIFFLLSFFSYFD